MSDIFWRHRHLLQVDDKVRVRIDPFFPKPEGQYPVGATGEIVGFGLKSICRTATFYHQPPGMYLEPEWPFVRFGTAVIRNIRSNSLELIDEAEYARRLERSQSENPRQQTLRGAFVSDLPDTEIWEGDIVRPKPNYGRGKNDKPKKLKKYGLIPGLPDAYMVTYMSFHKPGEIIESLDEYPRFSIGDRFLRTSKDGFLDYDLELVERGNFWRRAHGEPLVFKDLAEESFWAWMVGEVEYVPAPPVPRKPWEKDYSSSWSPDLQKEEAAKWYDERAALACVQDGNGHGLQTHRVLCEGLEIWHNVLRFKNEDLGRRVAEATANGFLVPSKILG